MDVVGSFHSSVAVCVSWYAWKTFKCGQQGRLDCNLQSDFAFQKKSRQKEKKKGNSRRLGKLQEVQTNPKYFEVFKIQMI